MPETGKHIKCVVWDLDHTIWDGILTEGPVAVNPAVCELIRELDNRGILHSIASRNDADLAEAKLTELNLLDYFIYPQIGWNAKSASIRHISQELNIGLDAIAFVDDQAYEREEVAFELPEVLCVDSKFAADLGGRPEFSPLVLTQEARTRRSLYVAESRRRAAIDTFTGPREEFLKLLSIQVEIGRAGELDLLRGQELAARTHQMNTTGRVYTYDQLDDLRQSDRHLLLTVRLTDKFGPYGTVGLTLIEKNDRRWTIKLMLVSCRVANRGVAAVLINYLRALARDSRIELVAEIVPNSRNRPMYISLIMNGFDYLERRGETVLLAADLTGVPGLPDYLEVTADLR